MVWAHTALGCSQSSFSPLEHQKQRERRSSEAEDLHFCWPGRSSCCDRGEGAGSARIVPFEWADQVALGDRELRDFWASKIHVAFN